MSNYLILNDTITGKEGKAFITIDGVNRELFEISSLKAQIDLKVQSKSTLGNIMAQHKVVGAEGTGSMTMYFMNSEMLDMAINYIKKGKYGNIKIQVKNEDAQSSVGKQEVVLSNVILNSIPVAQLDDQSEEAITFDTDFTFDSVEKLSGFVRPSNFR